MRQPDDIDDMPMPEDEFGCLAHSTRNCHVCREDAARDTTLPPEIMPEPETPFDTPQEKK